MIISFYSKVVDIQKRSRMEWVSGVGSYALFREVDIGYYMLLANSHEAMFVGMDKPDFNQGDRVKITFEKV